MSLEARQKFTLIYWILLNLYEYLSISLSSFHARPLLDINLQLHAIEIYFLSRVSILAFRWCVVGNPKTQNSN